MKAVTITCCVLVALAASACSPSTESDNADPAGSGTAAGSTATQAARPTLTDPKLQPPSQDNKYTQSTGRPKVVFDPCTWISDADIESVGFRPGSRKRGSDLVAEYTFLTCDFRTPDSAMSLGLDSGNITWEEDLQKNGYVLEPTTVNGRQAGLLRGEKGDESLCRVHLRTKVGVVIVRTHSLSLGRSQNLDPCANIMEIASVVEKSIGKEN
ncbi:DUF3558 domain-containing protein [Nocardia rhizosphaerihabitans]|uniref:DUF3558 domain-containing protein n=1 Tax=Nocardia rhizosphaerihabitans TaxID=1691570 RepID=A0ABQ2K8K8_9NOCA|nr:DUF3558 domain-containing protein [Nocardia rhizosphaerihabitans]GGN73107.1 hypothetical protein GCM10011610_15170 [Nocardia rhizosphaerihabitans]